MVNQELLTYIKQQQEVGVDKESIKNALVQNGWNGEDVEEAFLRISSGDAMVSASPTTQTQLSQATQTTSVKYAGFWIRALAFAVDGILTTLLIVALFWAYTISVEVDLEFLGEVLTLLIVFLPWGYFSLMTYYKGATLGKMLLGIKVHSEDYGHLSFGRVLLRETIGRLLSHLLLLTGYLMIPFSAKKQALHDKIAHTVVVYKKPLKKNKTGLVAAILLTLIFSVMMAFPFIIVMFV